jgi:hypothetical protein
VRRVLAWPVALAVALVSLTGACSSGSYSVQIQFASAADRERAEVIEIALVAGGCAERSPEEPPEDALQRRVLRRTGGASLAPIAGGRYGLHALARAASCETIAAGCSDVDLVAGGAGMLAVQLRSVTGPGCIDGTCVDGACEGETIDAGARRDGDAAPGDGGPLQPDAGQERDARTPMPDAGPPDGGPRIDAGPLTTYCGTFGVETLFCDGFEFEHPTALGPWAAPRVSLGAWLSTVVYGPLVGEHSLESAVMAATGSEARLEGALSTSISAGDLWVRGLVRVYETAAVQDLAMFELAGATGAQIQVRLGPEARIAAYLRTEAEATLGGTATVPRDDWSCIELHVELDDTLGAIEVFVDGASGGRWSGRDTAPTGGFDRVLVGVISTGPTQLATSLYFDELLVARERIPCE